MTGPPRNLKRSDLRSEHKAEETWRRHEIAGRLSALEQKQDKTLKLLERYVEVLDRLIAKKEKP